jgi:NTE family protein
LKLLAVCIGLLLLSGCASHGVIENAPLTESTATGSARPYSIMNYFQEEQGSGDIEMVLAFSGGGTRAAALAYGVLEELRDTTVVIEGQPRRLLDEIDVISSVSGGSFTSAYFGLHGDGIFEDFKEVFLMNNIEGKLFRGLFNPYWWFNNAGRSEMAVRLYDREVFHGATFADMQRDGPLIVINASDLGYGVRFSFVQEYFDLLCSDVASFPVVRAVTASSAVPLVFHPIVVKNYHDCKAAGKPDWLTAAAKRLANDHDMAPVVRGLESYYEQESRQYAHFVDGGITDNLGLRAVVEVVELAGGAEGFYSGIGVKPPRYVVLITVNASTNPEPEMDKSDTQPSVSETISAMSNVQLHRYNDATMTLTDKAMAQWAEAVSTTDRTSTPYHVQVGFIDIDSPEDRGFFDLIPTRFSLSEEQVDRLILAGRELLRNNPEFQRLLADLGQQGQF